MFKKPKCFDVLVEPFFKFLVRFIEVACFALGGILFFSTFAEVVLRYVLATLPGWVGGELPSFLLIWVAAFGIPLAVQRGEHLSVDMLPRYLGRKKLLSVLIRLFIDLMGIGFFIILLQGAWDFSIDNFSAKSPMLGISLFLINISIVVASLLSLIFLFRGFITCLSSLVDHQEVKLAKNEIANKGQDREIV